MKKIGPTFLFLFLGSCLPSWGMEATTILEVSGSRKSIILDRGIVEGIKIGEKAKLYVKEETDPNFPRYTYIAAAEAIKVHTGYSYWFLRRVDNFRLIKRGQKIVFIRKSQDPRRKLKVRQTKVIVPSKKNIKSYKESLNNDFPEDMIFEDIEYFPGQQLVGTDPTKAQDIETRDFGEWITNDNQWSEEYEENYDVMNPEPINNVVDKEKVKSTEENRVFDSSTEGAVDKINDLEFGLSGLYADSVKDKDNLRKKPTSDAMYDKIRNREKDPNFVSPRALSKIKRDGQGWSADMSDEQLRRFFVDSGIEKELRRQKKALHERGGHEINLRYTMGMSKHTTSEDPNHQSSDYAISIGYEFHLSHTSEKMENFTLEAELERGISHYDLGGVNGRFVEGTIKGYLNWYFWNSPAGIRQYLPYLGLGLRKGNADVTSFELTRDYEYQVTAVPSWHFGLKYRFKSGDTRDELVKLGLGLNFLLTYETVTLTVVDSLQDNINGVVENNQLKFAVGANIYF